MSNTRFIDSYQVIKILFECTEKLLKPIEYCEEIMNTQFYNKISEYAMIANQQMWNYDIWGYHDSLQYTTYFDRGGHYDWHLDIGPGSISHRKISVVIQLSDPNDYIGGDLQIMTGSEYTTVPRGKGNVVVFPSFLLHRVVPLTSGNRKSLVLWVGGEHYK